MKIIQLKIFFFFFFIYVKGQSQTTDSTVATITYKTVAYKDAKKVNSFYDISILKIGKISSRFFSRNNLDNESTIISIAKTNPFNGNIPMLKPTFPQDVEKYYTQDNFVIVEQLMTGRYGVRFDTSYNQEWKIDTVSKFIGGLKCIKAETIFKNRKYIVFFAPEIPITNGPWIFSGLPGLILPSLNHLRKHFRRIL